MPTLRSFCAYAVAQVLGWAGAVGQGEKRLLCTVCGYHDGYLTHERPWVGERVCPRCQQPLYTVKKARRL